MAIKNILKRDKVVDIDEVTKVTKTQDKKGKRRFHLPHRKNYDPSMAITWIRPSRAIVSAIEFIPFSIILGVACWALAFATNSVVSAVVGLFS